MADNGSVDRCILRLAVIRLAVDALCSLVRAVRGICVIGEPPWTDRNRSPPVRTLAISRCPVPRTCRHTSDHDPRSEAGTWLAGERSCDVVGGRGGARRELIARRATDRMIDHHEGTSGRTEHFAHELSGTDEAFGHHAH